MRQWRIVPWKSLTDQSQNYTVVIEHINERGTVECDIRHQMDQAEFDRLRKAVEDAR